MITRQLSTALASSRKSLLLLGPRQTGKSTLVRSLGPDLEVNFAHEPTYLEFLQNPSELEQRLAAHRRPLKVFIDEVQRLPSVLNTIQALLDNPKDRLQFYLTGSSARKLKRGHANLLPGRVHVYHLSPLSSGELGGQMDVEKAMAYGGLPGIWTAPTDTEREKTLRSYAATYLKEEVQAENLARNLEGFARFLSFAAVASGQFLDLSKLASLAQIPRQSAVRFFEILEDCLIVRRLDPFSAGGPRRLIQHPRFLLFDVGVLNGLLGNFQVSNDRVGSLFEQLVINQLFNEASARDLDVRLSSYRTEHGAEVDVIVEVGRTIFAVEIKAAKSIGPGDLRGLRSFRDYYKREHRVMLLCRTQTKKIIDGVEIWPWQEGLQAIYEE
jgi:predicted AAA+ superfamily ATPase